MRHRKKRSKLGMKTSHRKAALKSMVTSLFKYQRIRISLARAKEVRRLAEHLITVSKADTVAARRRVFSILTDRDMVGKLFKEITPLFKNRTSGYTRIIPMGFRRGDGASLCLIELTEKKIVEKSLPKKKKAKEGKAEAEKAAAEKKEEHKEEKKQEPKIKTISKSKPTLDEEKNREKAKSEDKKLADKRGFMKNLRGLFRKRGDF